MRACFRASRSYQELTEMADFLKVVVYNNVGERGMSDVLKTLDQPYWELSDFTWHRY